MNICADFNATTPLGQGAQSEMEKVIANWGNPSSTHALGRKASELLTSFRETVAAKTGRPPEDLVFTSGGAESNTMALIGAFWAFKEKPFRLLTAGVEHSSVKGTVCFLETQGAQVQRVRVEKTGELDMNDFAAKLKSFRPHLVSLMTANNETGVLFPISELAALCKEANLPFHTDAVQAFGKVDPSFWNGADMVSISAHKIHGPKGCGALLASKKWPLVSLHYGGSQETKRRGGTENAIGIAGFAGACKELTDLSCWNSIKTLRDGFEARLRKELGEVFFQGESAKRLPNTSSVRFVGVDSDALLTALDLDGVSISAGSACASGSTTPSHVLTEMGLTTAEARECVRISWGRPTTQADVDTVAGLVISHVQRIRARRRSM